MINLIISVPRLETHRPPISTAIIAASLKSNGHNVKCIDLNIEFYHFIGPDAYYELDDVWENKRKISKKEEKITNQFIKEKFIDILPDKCKVWISVFSQNSFEFTLFLTKQLRQFRPDIEIIVGGIGVSTPPTINSLESFGTYLQKNNLCNHVIHGEGEIAAVKLANNESHPGIDKENSIQINDLNSLPFPDYSDFNLDFYDYLSESKDKDFYIVGSRGCVRKCTYCDVPTYWPKYRFRDGINIAQEMIQNYEKYGVNRFYFTDSLLNGSLKSFNNMCETLAKYNSDHTADFKWSGQFIFRPKNQIPENHFNLVAAAGGDTFYVGVETGSDKIRFEMDKKFTNDDIDYQLEEFKKNKLKCFFLMITGYLTETVDDHYETLRMFKRWQKYVASNTVTGIDLGTMLTFLSNTPLEKMIETHGVTFLLSNDDQIGNQRIDASSWISTENPTLTIAERIRRRIEIQEEAIKYNWPIWRGEDRLKKILSVSQMLKNKQTITNL
jgi:radical SAM superfamily enzyme YgiQ (UPF0313 family)